MPDKDGDEGKSTKSVVNKKQKQMMGEEGYDIARDMGRVRPSKDKKDATTMPPSKEMKKTQKVNKGPSAFERVKAKYGKSVMKVEELDLSKVAEAFGGYLIEQEPPTYQDLMNQQKNNAEDLRKKLQNKKSSGKSDKELLNTKRFDPSGYINMVRAIGGGKKGAALDKEILARRAAKEREQQFIKRQTQPQPDTKEIGDTQSRQTLSPKGQKRLAKISKQSKITDTTVSDFKKKLQDLMKVDTEGSNADKGGARRRAERDPEIALMTPGQKERNIRRIKKDIDDRNPTIQTQVGPVPYRNRRVPKTRTLVPQYDRTPEIMKPDTDELLKFKDFRKKTKTTTAELDKNQEFKAPPIPQSQPEGGGGDGKGKGRKKTATGGFDGSRAFNSIKQFAKDNPAASLAAYDMGKGILGKIKKYSKAAIKSLNVQKSTKTGRISAGT
jgi:hypothetical protein